MVCIKINEAYKLYHIINMGSMLAVMLVVDTHLLCCVCIRVYVLNRDPGFGRDAMHWWRKTCVEWRSEKLGQRGDIIWDFLRINESWLIGDVRRLWSSSIKLRLVHLSESIFVNNPRQKWIIIPSNMERSKKWKCVCCWFINSELQNPCVRLIKLWTVCLLFFFSVPFFLCPEILWLPEYSVYVL